MNKSNYSLVKNTWRFIVGLLFIILLSQLEWELGLGEEVSIPITGQSLAIIVVCMLFRKKQGFLIVASYIILGAFGLPIFSGGSSGWIKLVGPTAGYLWSFLLIPIIVGNGSFDRSFVKILGYQLLATICILVCGWLRLTFILPNAFEIGVEPFLGAGLLKSVLGSVIVFFIQFISIKQ